MRDCPIILSQTTGGIGMARIASINKKEPRKGEYLNGADEHDLR